MHLLKRKFVCGGACFALIALSACATQVAAPPSTNSPMSKNKKTALPLLSRNFPLTSHPETKAVAPPAPISPSSSTVPPPVAEKTSAPVLFPITPDDPSIQLYIDYFQYADHRRFKEWLERSHEYLPYIQQTFREMGLPEDLAYVSLIESGFSARAYSRTGAAGLWQFMRGTGVKYGLKVNYWIDQRRDPILATRSAAQYLKDLHDEFDSWELALAAYNAGEGRVANAVSRAGTKNYWKLRQTHEFSSETRNYIPKLIAAMTIAKNPARYGFTDLAYHPAVIVRQKAIHRSVEIRKLARAMNMSVPEFLVYNPQFIRWATPPQTGLRDRQCSRRTGKGIFKTSVFASSDRHQSGCSGLPGRVRRLALVHCAQVSCSPSGVDCRQPSLLPSPQPSAKAGHSCHREHSLGSSGVKGILSPPLCWMDRPPDQTG